MNWMRKKLLEHRGHNIVCVSYGLWDDPADVTIECEDCGCVLVSAEDYEDSNFLNYDMAMDDIKYYLQSRSDDWFAERRRGKEEVLEDKELLDELATEHLRSVNKCGCDRDWSCADACDCDPGIENK